MTEAGGFFAAWKFQHPWRSYQIDVMARWARLEKEAVVHLVAPPGSGKTVIGLEFIRRWGRPALIVVPTLNLQSQWWQRLGSFGIDNPPAGRVTLALATPGLLTITTFQAVHMAVVREGVERVAAMLLQAGCGVLVLDEAHHLRRAWQRSVLALRAALPGIRTLALTATPPYDADAIEWNAYLELCGPIDVEIELPLLVQAGSLCPHQDLLWLCAPDPEAAGLIAAQGAQVEAFVRDLCFDQELLDWLAARPELLDPEMNIAALLARSEFYLAVAVFLNGIRTEVAQPLIGALGLKGLPLPAFGGRFPEQLLLGLFDEALGAPAALTGRLKSRLEAIGCWEHAALTLGVPRSLQRRILYGASKIRVVREILELEQQELGHELRAVVLCDHIRSGHLPVPGHDAPAARLGVIPVFEELRRLRMEGMTMGVITGTLVILPRRLVEANGVKIGGQCSPLWHDADWVRVDGWASGDAVRAVTSWFEAGELNVLIGTASLLGEGWDAPTVNTLVLSSQASTHVLSHQMRGRAMRVDPERKWKVSNIWHVGCVDGVSDDGGDEMRMLHRRLAHTCGPDAAGAVVRSGWYRLGLPTEGLTVPSVREAWNRSQRVLAAGRDDLGQRWRRALAPVDGARTRRIVHLTLREAVGSAEVRAGVEGWRDGAWIPRWWRRWRMGAEAAKIGRVVAEMEADLLKVDAPRVGVLWRNGDLVLTVTGGESGVQERVAAELESLFDVLRKPRYLFRARWRTYALPDRHATNRQQADRWASLAARRGADGILLFARSPEGQRLLLQMREYWLAAHGAEPLLREMSWTANRSAHRDT